MFGIAATGGRRGQATFDWRAKATLYSLAAFVAAAASGAALGFAGSLLSGSIRVTAASITALGLAVVGLAQLRPDSRLRLWERDCETAQSWLRYGPVRWALLNGAALGAGFTSRIGFVSWYLIPLSCLFFGSPLLGMVIYGAYGAVRGFAVWFWFVGLRRAAGQRSDDVIDSVLDLSAVLKRLTAAALVAIATATVVVIGL